jgi:ubiquinone biosynthesis protein COQ9
MMEPPERSPERDAAVVAVLEHVPALGWTRAALRAALRDLGQSPEDAEILFPGGVPDLLEVFADWSDRRMEAEAASLDLAERPLHERVRALILLRLAQKRAHKEAVRRALALLALPRHAVRSARVLARTVDAIWHAAGDRAADFSWYTKRATLAGIYSATLLFWLADDSDDDAATVAFLDRRLAGIAGIGRLHRRARDCLRRLRPGRWGDAAAEAT